MPLYTAYGLGIDSCLTLPELVAGADKIDLTIRKERILDKPSEISQNEFFYWRGDRETGLHWQALGTFLIRAGKEIIIETVGGVDEEDLHPALLGACLAVALHQRGHLILHASAVKIGDKAIAFIGNKGWGKSTIASAFIEQEYQFITDDVLAIDLSRDRPLVYPSFPQLKLCPDAVVAMGKDPETLPRVMSQTTKRQYRPDRNFNTDSVTLQSIYLLNKGAELQINKIAAQDSILPLLAHSYGARFGKELLELGEAEHFLQCTQLANRVGIYSLQRPSDISLLADTVNLIQQFTAI